MSSISLPYEKQIRHFFPITAIASETDAQTFAATASNGEAQLLMEQGTTAGAGPDFYIIKKDSTGKVVKSDLITPKDITYIKVTDPRAKTGKTQVLTLTGVTPGAIIGISLKINYAGSEENFEYIYANTKVAASGDTATTVMTRLSKQLGDALANSVYTSTTIAGLDTIIAGTTVRKNKYFTLTQVAGALTITEKDWILDGYVVGLKTYDQLMWNAELETKNETQFAQTTKTSTAPVFATGQGYQMLELERYFVGHRAEFPGPDITLSFTRPYEIVATSSYYCLDIKYFDVSRNDPYQSDKMLTLVSTTEGVIDGLFTTISELITPPVETP